MLSKCATSPGHASPCSLENTYAGSQHFDGVSEDSRTKVDKSPALMRCSSLAPKSALRGGHEQLGLGPRPKLHVKWAPSVWEPPCSSISHTVKHNRSRKKHSKHGQKGKASFCKKREKISSHKAKRNSDSAVFSVHGSFSDAKPDSELSTGLSKQESICYEPNTVDENEVSGSGMCFELADGKDALLNTAGMSGFKCPHDFKCGGSVLGICGRIQNHFPYGEAI